tara:strand:+ start:340 stop:537 length:198 start_codon:yes stop_codon:yes gene_type:complete
MMRKGDTMTKYDKQSQKEVEKAVREYKEGKLTMGSNTNKKVTSQKQAVAIGLSKARQKGSKAPKP